MRRIRVHKQPGENIVELALLIAFLLTMTLGLVDFGRVMYAHVGITNAAREGARRATLDAAIVASCNEATIEAAAIAEQPSLGLTGAMISVDCSQSDRRTVSISYPVTLASPFLAPLLTGGTGVVQLQTWAAMPVMTN